MQIINRIFNLRPGDFARGLPLFAYYFLKLIINNTELHEI